MNNGNACDGWAPVLLSARAYAAMTIGDLQAVTKHNEHGEKVCGWKAPAR